MVYIDSDIVHEQLTMPAAINLAKEAFKIKANGHLIQPVRNIVNGGDFGLMGTMPVFISEGIYKGFGVKSVTVKFDQLNGAKPSHNGAVLIYSDDGTEFSVVDATAITEIRTAAASALATDILAKSDAKSLAILGTGMQARAHLKAMCEIRPIQNVHVWGRDIAKAEHFSRWGEQALGVDVVPCKTIEKTVGEADIICTTTAARESILFDHYIKDDVHINAIGASALGFRELDSLLFKRADLYTDCNESVLASSQAIIDAVECGYLSAPNIGTEIGDMIGVDWTRSDNHITIFKSVGLAVQDIVVAKSLLAQQVSA